MGDPLKDEKTSSKWMKYAPYAVLLISGILLLGVFALSQGLIGEEGTTEAPSFSQEDIDGQSVSIAHGDVRVDEIGHPQIRPGGRGNSLPENPHAIVVT